MSLVMHISPLFLGLPFPVSHPQGFHKFIDEMLPHESPVHYGLHPNAEIEFLTVTSDNLFHTLLELQSPDAVMGEGASQTLEEKVGTATNSLSSFSHVFPITLHWAGEDHFRRGAGEAARGVQHV